MRLIAALLLATAAPAWAQQPDPHAGHDMAQPAQETADPHAGHDMAQPAPQAADPHAGHDMAQPAQETADPHAGPATSEQPAIGNAPPPAPPTDHAADAVWDRSAMAESRRQLARETGEFTGSMLMIDLAERQFRSGRDSYRLEGEAWLGGDIDRMVIKAEGEGQLGRQLEEAEAQLLYSRAITPFFNLQAGVRHDFRPRDRTYAALTIEGMAPYWFEVEGSLFLSGKGDVLARLEGSYDQRITQKLILQPRAELNFAAQDVPEMATGAGLSDAEVGLRLRYELVREFAPYVGVEWSKSFGRTARLLRAEGEDPDSLHLVAGLRVWF